MTSLGHVVLMPTSICSAYLVSLREELGEICVGSIEETLYIGSSVI